MSRLLAILLGDMPDIDVKYYCDKAVIVLTDDDVANGIVRVKYHCLESDYLTFREFHCTYSASKPVNVTNKQKFELKE